MEPSPAQIIALSPDGVAACTATIGGAWAVVVPEDPNITVADWAEGIIAELQPRMTHPAGWLLLDPTGDYLHVLAGRAADCWRYGPNPPQHAHLHEPWTQAREHLIICQACDCVLERNAPREEGGLWVDVRSGNDGGTYDWCDGTAERVHAPMLPRMRAR